MTLTNPNPIRFYAVMICRQVLELDTGTRTSLLTINNAEFSDSGRITCKNPSDIFDTDDVMVRVSSFEEGVYRLT